MDIARYLAETIGPRPAGSQKEREAALYIQDFFEKEGLKTSIQPFRFLNWTPVERPMLEVLKPEPKRIALAPMGYTEATGPDGVTGVVKKIGKMVLIPGYKEWDKYTIGQDEAFLVKNPAEGDASPFPSGRPLLPEVGAILSKEDGDQIDRWLEAGQEVVVRFTNFCRQEIADSQNVVGIWGEGPAELVVCAHYDSAFYAPGAVDNGSGMQALADMVRRFAGETRKGPAVAFVAMGCEEPGLLGSTHFVYHLQEHNEIQQIRYCVNFDMIGNGKELVLRKGLGMDDLLEELVQENRDNVSHSIAQVPATASSDNWPFHLAGVPNMQFVSLPFPLYHLPADTMDIYDPKLVEETEYLAEILIRKILRRLDERRES